MSTYSEMVTQNREDEIKRRQEEILKIIDDSKSYVTECDNLVKLRALKKRCEKITMPRPPRETKPKNDEKRV